MYIELVRTYIWSEHIYRVGQNIYMVRTFIWSKQYTVRAKQYTVRSRSLRDHTFKKLINIMTLVREGVWGLIFEFEFEFEFEGTLRGPCRELFFEFESPLVNAACALLLLFVMAEAG